MFLISYIPLEGAVCNTQMDHQYIPVCMCKKVNDWWLDNLHFVRKYQDKGPDICFVYKLCLKDNRYWEHTLVCNLRKDFLSNRASMYKIQLRSVLYKWRYHRKVKVHKDLYFQLV